MGRREPLKIPLLQDRFISPACPFLHTKMDMKKYIITAVWSMVIVLCAQAQVERPTEIKKVQSAPIKKMAPGMLPQATNPGTPPPPPASTANLTPGKDLSIRIKSFTYNPDNGGSIQVNYVVKNNGTEALDINMVNLQGYFDYTPARPTDPAPTWPVNGKNYFVGCGIVLSSVSSILNSGQEKEGVLNCFNISRNHYFNTYDTYNYMLWVDKDSKISEANESNNFATYSFRGYQGMYNPSVSSSQYYLTEAFINIKTGADNKEKESEVKFRLVPAVSKDLNNTYNEFVGGIPKNQQPLFPNTSATFPLNLFMSSTTTTVNPATSMAALTQNGFGLVIEYKANFALDAWKIEQVELTLYFKDANGLFHPTQGVKTVRFNMPANTFLDGVAKKFLVCKTDSGLSPVSIKTIERLSEY